MKPPDDLTRLGHIIDAAETALRFVEGKNRSELDTHELLGLALVRLLEVVGEAAGGISEEFRTRYPDIPWRQMSGMRNRLIHGYFAVNTNLVWETVTGELPPLILKLQKVRETELNNANP